MVFFLVWAILHAGHTLEASQRGDIGIVYVYFIFIFNFLWFRMLLPGPETTAPLIDKDILGSCAHSAQPRLKEFKAHTRFRPLSTAGS